MNEEYLQEVWNWSTSADPTLSEKIDFNAWKEKISTDSGYQQRYYDWINSVDESFIEGKPFDAWVNKLKKKRRWRFKWGRWYAGFFRDS